MRRVKRKQQEVCDVDLNLDDCDLVGKLRGLQNYGKELLSDLGKVKRISYKDYIGILESIFNIFGDLNIPHVYFRNSYGKFDENEISHLKSSLVLKEMNGVPVNWIRVIAENLIMYCDRRENIEFDIGEIESATKCNNDEILMIKNKLGIK